MPKVSRKGEIHKRGVCNSCGQPRETNTRCKPCRNARLREWYAQNPQRQAAAKQRYVASHPDRYAEQCRAYKQRPEVKLINRLRANILYRTYTSTEGEFTVFDLKRLTIAQRGLCALCGEAEPLTIDHVIPLSRGGTNHPANVQLLCRSCNSRKGTKIMSGIAHFLALREIA